MVWPITDQKSYVGEKGKSTRVEGTPAGHYQQTLNRSGSWPRRVQDPALREIGDSNVRKANTDYIIPGVPNEQLRFAALNGDSAIVFDEWGGYADQAATLFPFFK